MRSSLSTAILGWLLVALPLKAQHPDSVLQIPPLTVEVLRSSLAGARAPYAVAGLDQADLRDGRAAAFLADALLALPGLQVQNRYNFAVGERLAVRGFGARAQFGVRGIRVIVDGIPATLPDGQSTLDHVDLASLGSAELLRGPASALYGNGAGAVLLLSSRRPAPGRRFTLQAAGGTHGLRAESAQAEWAAGERSTLASVSRLDYEGYRANPVAGGTYGAARRWTLNTRHVQEIAGGSLAVTVAAVDLDAENPGSLPADSLGDPDRSAWGFNVRRRTGKTVRQAQAGGSWTGSLGPGEARVSAWALTRDVRNPIPTSVIGLDRRAGGFGAAWSGSAPGGARWDAGLDLELQSDQRTNHENDGGQEGSLVLDQGEHVRALGAYARFVFERDRFAVHVAVRHDGLRFRARDRIVTAADPDGSGTRTFRAWSPSLGALLDVTPGLSAFASASSFLQTPTTSELANRPDGSGGFNPGLESTRGWSAEVGLRGRAGGHLAWEVLAFRTDLRDELVPFEVPDQSGRTFFRNAARSLHRGWEATLRAALPGGWTARAAYTGVDARFRTAFGTAAVGDRIPGRARGRLEASIEKRSSSLWGAVDLRWSGAVPVNDGNTAQAAPFTLVDVRVGAAEVALGAGRLVPFVTLRNAFDRTYVSSVVVNAFGGRYYEPGPGRTLHVGLSITLGTDR